MRLTERDFADVLAKAGARAARLPTDGCSRALVIDGTDHYFGDSAARLAAAIAPFIARALGGNCG